MNGEKEVCRFLGRNREFFQTKGGRGCLGRSSRNDWMWEIIAKKDLKRKGKEGKE